MCCTAATTATSTSGTPATSPTTCRVGPAACRSGSAWPRYGTEAYRDAIETTLDVTRQGARLIDDAAHLELIMEPELSILLFRRTGWNAAEYQAWSDRLLDEGTAFVTPTSWNGEVRAAAVHRQPADDRRRHSRSSSTRWPELTVADLLIRNARLLATVDADRRELAGGWVAITGGLIEAVGASTDAARRPTGRSTPPTASSRRA